MNAPDPYILAYNAGNARSVAFALERSGFAPRIGSDPEAVRDASHLIFPGVGHAGPALRFLREKGSDRALQERNGPTLGICLGLQLMCTRSEEGDVEGLGFFEEVVRKFPMDRKEKVPHMGWNDVHPEGKELFGGISDEGCFYFVHGYYVEAGPNAVGKSEYILPFASALARPPFYGVQFHPERSGPLGERLLENFMAL